jgi:type I restriction enzyme S subunit
VFAIQGNSTTIAHLTAEQLKVQRFPFPRRAVQDALVKVLDERRQALITAAVTGQIDVTTARGVSG